MILNIKVIDMDCYDTPPQEIFDDIKKAAIEIWDTYDDKYGYATEKKDIVNSIDNNKDNGLYIVAMFDHINQSKLLDLVTMDTEKYILQFLNK